MMNELLLVAGGMRVGDTLMLLPGIRGMIKKYNISSFDWVHGTWASQVIELFRHCDVPVNKSYIVPDVGINTASGVIASASGKPIKLQRPLPVDLDDVSAWLQNIDLSRYPEYKHTVIIDRNRYGQVDKSHQHYWWANAIGIEPHEIGKARLTLKDDKPTDDGYIVVQPDTISKMKRIPSIFQAMYPTDRVYSVGMPGEAVVPGSIDYRGRNLLQVARLINHCTLFVGVCSSVAKLAEYLGKPTIMCHFSPTIMEEVGVSYTDSPRNIDLLMPEENDIEEACFELMERRNK